MNSASITEHTTAEKTPLKYKESVPKIQVYSDIPEEVRVSLNSMKKGPLR